MVPAHSASSRLVVLRRQLDGSGGANCVSSQRRSAVQLKLCRLVL